MANVLLAWELGGGLGHLVNLLPLAKNLRERGHCVVAALRDLSRVNEVFQGHDVTCLQAPIKTRIDDNRFDPPRTFSHILYNTGFGDYDELCSLATAWKNLYDLVRPDLIVFDHSPMALLAARGSKAKRALIGTGFFCPSDTYPLPNLRPWMGNQDAARLCADEDRVLSNVNRLLKRWGQPPLERLSQLYSQVDENFLATFPELDHFPERKATTYWGAWPNIGGTIPSWPAGNGKKVFAYLKPFPTLPSLLALLCHLQCPTVVYADGIDQETQSRFRSRTLRFVAERPDLKETAKQCDLAVLNGNHGTTVSMLLAGKPTLQVPVTLEQALLSSAVVRMGAGLGASPVNLQEVQTGLFTLMNSSNEAQAAQRFMQRHADFDDRAQIAKMLSRSEELLHLN